MHIHPLGDVHNKVHIGIVVVIWASRNLIEVLVTARVLSNGLAYFDILISHPDVVRIGLQIFWCCHHRKLYGSLVAEGFVGPFSHRSNFFDCSNAVVRNQNLQKASVDHFCQLTQKGQYVQM